MGKRRTGKREKVLGGMQKGFESRLASKLAKNLGKVKNIYKK